MDQERKKVSRNDEDVSFFIETFVSHTDAPGTVADVNSTILTPNPTSSAAIDGSLESQETQQKWRKGEQK